MTTRRDLVEAASFSRRRLATAFVSGAAGDPQVARPGRTVVAGLALTVLLLAGAAVAGALAPRGGDEPGNDERRPPSRSAPFRGGG